VHANIINAIENVSSWWGRPLNFAHEFPARRTQPIYFFILFFENDDRIVVIKLAWSCDITRYVVTCYGKKRNDVSEEPAVSIPNKTMSCSNHTDKKSCYYNITPSDILISVPSAVNLINVGFFVLVSEILNGWEYECNVSRMYLQCKPPTNPLNHEMCLNGHSKMYFDFIKNPFHHHYKAEPVNLYTRVLCICWTAHTLQDDTRSIHHIYLSSLNVT